MRLPVYVLVTKTDLLAGFNEYFGDARARRSASRSGASPSRYAPTSTDDPLVNFGAEFAALEKRLRRRPDRPRMQRERDGTQRAAIFGFPQQFAGLRGAARRLPRAGLHAGGALEQRPLLRGVYFTSGTQEGTPIDRVMGTPRRAASASSAPAAAADEQRAARATSSPRC